MGWDICTANKNYPPQPARRDEMKIDIDKDFDIIFTLVLLFILIAVLAFFVGYNIGEDNAYNAILGQ